MELFAEIKGIKYTPLLCRELKIYPFQALGKALEKDASFLLKIGKNYLAISWWVSAKRTRSYPYARIYDTLSFSGKKVTIIPIFKDEGLEGDRDFLQWDTISLMSLLGIYVIIAYYRDAQKSTDYNNKITKQRFDISYLEGQIKKILAYQCDALHWNLSQIEEVDKIGEKAIQCYTELGERLQCKMHSQKSAEKRFKKLAEGKENFMNLSRELAKKAQARESITIQPKEKLEGKKATITIKNYLGGYYYLTTDEYILTKDKIYLIEGKHSKSQILPSLEDIKDGLLKMVLFSNLEEVRAGDTSYQPLAMLKLTTEKEIRCCQISEKYGKILKKLKMEAKINGFILKMPLENS